MQRSITFCDRCNREGLEDDHGVLTLAGTRAHNVRASFPGGRNQLDLCDDCLKSLGSWVAAGAATEEPPAKPIDFDVTSVEAMHNP